MTDDELQTELDPMSELQTTELNHTVEQGENTFTLDMQSKIRENEVDVGEDEPATYYHWKLADGDQLRLTQAQHLTVMTAIKRYERNEGLDDPATITVEITKTGQDKNTSYDASVSDVE